ncbi:unnamed protein product [Schistosoma rodhaini]|uniref:Adenylate kinase active site lid domain-containing protein n=1 Tax=Schistosoma rodhaini TaxID=6188 RepID=A0AA85EV62_9TREM|nr:unnamed protein product [Schistosoma rodhaini]CAH8661645.1 unnamed protein product [Schistosoma rodhaini]
MRFSQAFTSNVRAVIIGPPGSGKATISLRLQKDFALKYICCGDMLRNHVVLKTDIGDQVSRFIQNGSLVPDSLVTKMVIAECQSYTSDNLLIDGFPRTMIQAKDIQRQLPIACVLCLDVPFEEIINRISGRYTHLPSGRTYNDKFNPPKRKVSMISACKLYFLASFTDCYNIISLHLIFGINAAWIVFSFGELCV